MDNAQQRENAARSNSSYSEYQMECRTFTTLVEQVECLLDKSSTTYDQKHTHQDLRAQQDVAGATIVLMAMGVVGLLASMVGIALVYENLFEMRKQSGIQRAVGENQVKAYVWVSSAAFILPDPNGTKKRLLNIRGRYIASIRIKIENSGATPALEVNPTATLTIKAHTANALAPLRTRFQSVPTGEKKVDSVMPATGEPMFLAFPYERKDEIQTALSESWAEQYGVERMEVDGRVTYRDVFGHLYETEFSFYAVVKESGNLESMFRVKEGKAMFRKIKDASEYDNEKTGA
ncbi:hypothetical protein [Hyphomonas chukchiensis]|uniref:Uncharacterized protein n=1 Tax=Hyphomonas chukchiensis TaxID=1280947 RepID=A0A062UNG6_9PROT|nr:hypothetical protein [Hyphomonas chukchiensis]KCZ60830.1 hypothetical protein HY30_00425 [Hyphomonas chukchiensis]